MDIAAVSSLLATASIEKQVSASSIQAIARPMEVLREAFMELLRFGG